MKKNPLGSDVGIGYESRSVGFVVVSHTIRIVISYASYPCT